MNRLLLLSIGIIVGCCVSRPHESNDSGPAIQIGGKAYVKLYAENVGDTIKIGSSYLDLLTLREIYTEEFEIGSDSLCFLTFESSIATKYDLVLSRELTIPIFVVPGDTLTIHVDYRENKSAPVIGYEGSFHEINKYLFEKSQHTTSNIDDARLFNDPFREESPEKTLLLYKHKTDSLAAIEQAYVEENADSYNLPSWFVEYQKIESVLSAGLNQFVVSDYWQMFFNLHVMTPPGYFDSIRRADVTNPNALYSPYYYFYLPAMIAKMPEFEEYENRFVDSCGVKSVHDLRGTKAYATYYLNLSKHVTEKADELLPDELYHAFLTNYFFHMVRILDPAGTEQLLRFMKVKLHGTPYLSFMLENYENFSLHLSAGTAAPDFYLLDDEDKYLTLANFKGKVLLLNFWFPGCKPCLYEIPYEKQLLRKYSDKGFEIINICMEATVKHWQVAINKWKLEGVNVVTQGGWEKKLKQAYGVDAFPHYVLIDKKGKIVQNQTHTPSDPRLGELIEVTLNQ